MNLVLLEQQEAEEGTVSLPIDDTRAHHLQRVKNVRSGDVIAVGVIGGLRGTARVLSISKRELKLEVLVLDEAPPCGLDYLTLIVAVARPQIMKRVFFHAAMVGAGELVVTGADKSEASYFQSKLFREQRYLSFIREGLEQAMATKMPRVTTYPKFHLLLRNAAFGDYSQLFAAHPDAPSSLARLFERTSRGSGRIALAIGPEGGWQAEEIKALERVGFSTFHMGDRILRVDAAAAAACAQLSLLGETVD